jgi:hypothetical protein
MTLTVGLVTDHAESRLVSIALRVDACWWVDSAFLATDRGYERLVMT